MFSGASVLAVVAGAFLASAQIVNATCDPSTLNTTSFSYYIGTANQTIYDIAVKFNRGVCDIGRANLMVDVSIVPNVGQNLTIPAEVCDPDWTTCIIDGPGTNDCLAGGPRLYYTVNGDTYWKIAGRLNMTLDAVGCDAASCNANETLAVDQFVKIPLCYPSTCEIEPYSFTEGVYKDLAENFNSTVGQIQMLSPTYNYSHVEVAGEGPTIVMAINCHILADNYTIIS